ncbi:MAG: hypothetical protein E7474_04465 [Ruminococcaceae bacterium]|nr:hypothetical protein [Oscillospiraceae bacterium]
MKKKDWMVFAALAVAAVAARAGQMLTGFDDTGLPVRGNVFGILLPVVLAAAAVYFCLAARGLSAERSDKRGLADRFRFSGMASVTAAVCGAFLVLAGAGMSVLNTASTLTLLLAVFDAASALCLLYAVFGLYRGGEVQGMALLVPVCALVVNLILRYRADASDPVLGHVYVELLALAALTACALELAAFAFRNGSPRVFLPLAALSALLAAAAASEWQSMPYTLLFAGSALLALGFLAATRLEE